MKKIYFLLILMFAGSAGLQAQIFKYFNEMNQASSTDAKALNDGYLWKFFTQTAGEGNKNSLIKTNADGTPEWRKAADNFGLSCYTVNPDGNLILGGGYSVAGSETSALLAKWNPEGGMIWNKTFAAQSFAGIASLVSNESIIYACMTSSSFFSSTQFSKSTVIALDQTGTVLWTQGFAQGGFATDYSFRNTLIAENGDFVGVADIRGSINSQACGIMITRINPAGTVVFAKYINVIDSVTQSSVNGLVETASGDFIIAARLMPDQISTYPNTGYLAKVSSSGELLNQRRIFAGIDAGEMFVSLKEHEGDVFASMFIYAPFQDVQQAMSVLRIDTASLAIESSNGLSFPTIATQDPYGDWNESFDIAADGTFLVSGIFYCEAQQDYFPFIVTWTPELGSACEDFERQIAFSDSAATFPFTDYVTFSGPTITNGVADSISMVTMNIPAISDLCEGCDLSTGFSVISATDEINFFPNPAKENIVINSNDNSTQKWSIVNTAGQSVATGEFKGSASINLNAFSSGIYFLKINGKVDKLVIQD